MSAPIRTRFVEGVYELELCAPPLNEIGLDMLAALESFVAEIDVEKGRALVIYSSLPQGFCAGADLRGLYHGLVATRDVGERARRADSRQDADHGAEKSPDQREHEVRRAQRDFEALHEQRVDFGHVRGSEAHEIAGGEFQLEPVAEKRDDRGGGDEAVEHRTQPAGAA